MFPKMTKCVKGLGGFGLLGLLLVVGGGYLYDQYTAEMVEERIYVVPERSEWPAVQPKPAFQPVPAHTPPTSAAAVSYDEDLSAAHDHDYESDTFSDGGDVFLTEISEDPVLSESAFDAAAAEEARIAEIGLQIEKLTEAHYEKYPELLELANLSRAEIEALSPLERSELGKIGRKAQREFLREFRGLFLQMPSAVRADALVHAHDYFTGHLGRETADIIMKEVRSLLGE